MTRRAAQGGGGTVAGVIGERSKGGREGMRGRRKEEIKEGGREGRN